MLCNSLQCFLRTSPKSQEEHCKSHGALQCFGTRSCDCFQALCCCANKLQLSIEYSVEYLSSSFQKFCMYLVLYPAPRDKVALPLPHFALTISAPGYPKLSRHSCAEIMDPANYEIQYPFGQVACKIFQAWPLPKTNALWQGIISSSKADDFFEFWLILWSDLIDE